MVDEESGTTSAISPLPTWTRLKGLSKCTMRDLSTGTTILAVERPGEMLMTIGVWPFMSTTGGGIARARGAAAAGNVAQTASTSGTASLLKRKNLVIEIAAGTPAPLAAAVLPHKN